jgi:hypothetical protein
MWLYLDINVKHQEKPHSKSRIHEMSTALTSSLIDSENGENNSSEMKIEGGGTA